MSLLPAIERESRDMYKNQLQELAQRSCFNLPSYTSIREGPDHAPRFKAVVNFNGESFESPSFCTTLRQAEHAAAEVALNVLSNRGPSYSLAARILDETGVYKNLLQEVSQRVGASLPLYSTLRSGSGHQPYFTCTVELAGITFTGEQAKNKKQAEKNAAMTAWLSLKQLAQESSGPSSTAINSDEQEHSYLKKVKPANSPFPVKFPVSHSRISILQPPPMTASKILPLIYPKNQRPPGVSSAYNPNIPPHSLATGSSQPRRHKFPAIEAVPYIPIRHLRPCHGIAPPVTIRNIIPAYSAPVSHPPGIHMNRPQPMKLAPPVHIRQAVPVFSASPSGSNGLVINPPVLLNKPSPAPQDQTRVS
ncbi:hypothetical protein V2J09_008335 [Rumex salicifolius]